MNVAKVIGEVEAELQAIVDSAISLVEEIAMANSSPISVLEVSEEVLKLQRYLLLELHRIPAHIAGAGIAFRPGVVNCPDGPIAWFSLMNGEVIRKVIDTSTAVDFTAMDWFQSAIDVAHTTIHGPYVDPLCNDRYTLTVSCPAVFGGVTKGVFAVDILVSDIEDIVLPIMVRTHAPLAVINREGRVVTSTDLDLSTGLVAAQVDHSGFLFRIVEVLKLRSDEDI